MDKIKSPAEKLLEHITKKSIKHNIPVICILGDRKTKRTGVVIDNRAEMREINQTILLDAMLNQPKEVAKELVNAILGASAILCSQVDGVWTMYKDRVAQLREDQKQVTPNVAEA